MLEGLHDPGPRPRHGEWLQGVEGHRGRDRRVSDEEPEGNAERSHLLPGARAPARRLEVHVLGRLLPGVAAATPGAAAVGGIGPEARAEERPGEGQDQGEQEARGDTPPPAGADGAFRRRSPPSAEHSQSPADVGRLLTSLSRTPRPEK